MRYIFSFVKLILCKLHFINLEQEVSYSKIVEFSVYKKITVSFVPPKHVWKIRKVLLDVSSNNTVSPIILSPSGVARGQVGAHAPGRRPCGRNPTTHFISLFENAYLAEIYTKICLKLRIFWKKQ